METGDHLSVCVPALDTIESLIDLGSFVPGQGHCPLATDHIVPMSRISSSELIIVTSNASKGEKSDTLVDFFFYERLGHKR